MSDEERGSGWDAYGLDQIVVEGWVRRTFGDKLMDNPIERGRRVLEEAIELFQTSGGSIEEAAALVKTVFGKPKGNLQQEVGGVIVTLLALCAHHGLRLDDIAKVEIERILSQDREAFRRKQGAKADLGIADRPE